MAVQLPCYCSREEVQRALDVTETARNNVQVDRAIESARDAVEGLCKRRFYNVIETNYWDWPNFQRSYPWRIWFDQAELADVTVFPPTVTTGGTPIPDSAIFWGHPRYSPPYTYMELDRSQSYAFGVGSTPQRDVAILGCYGYWLKTAPAGSLAVAMSDTTTATCTVSDGAAVGVGDVLIAGSESMLVQDKNMVDSSQALTGAGCTTALTSDNLLGVTTGADYTVGEVLQIDAEQLLITSITGNSLTVKRAWNGTAIATHATPEIYAARLLTVVRGDLGSAAATHLINAPLTINVVPGMVKELAVAEALNNLLQETSGYARTLAVPGAGNIVPGGALPDLRDKCREAFGRKLRQRVI